MTPFAESYVKLLLLLLIDFFVDLMPLIYAYTSSILFFLFFKVNYPKG